MFLIIDFWLSSQDVCFVFIAMVQYLGKNQCKSHFHYMLFTLKFNGVNAINNDKKIDYI